MKRTIHVLLALLAVFMVGWHLGKRSADKWYAKQEHICVSRHVEVWRDGSTHSVCDDVFVSHRISGNCTLENEGAGRPIGILIDPQSMGKCTQRKDGFVSCEVQP